MDFQEFLRLAISGFVGTFGFTLLFRSNKNRVIISSLGGLLTCVVYALSCVYFDHELMQNLFPALVATIYAEIMARMTKAPATPILACSIIPLVPGGKLYYTTYYFVVGEMENFYDSFIALLRIASGLAVGIILVSVAVHEINRHKFKHIFDVD
ncbi:MAG: threonine/serine exporter family protein [Clostridia bacterium]|nr:threonine/serine exporter family protein [Clostridia bacterium]